jgi:hypothetical protein
VCLKPLSHLSTKAASVAECAALFNSKLRGHGEKLQASTSKLQRKLNHQIPKSVICLLIDG